MNREKIGWMIFGTIFAWLVFGAVPLWLGIYNPAFGIDLARSGQIGDMFGAGNALFSGLALVGVIYAIILQQAQLRAQRHEMKRHSQEMRQMRIVADRSLRADVLMEFNRRFDLVSRLRYSPERDFDSKYFFVSFWSLQMDQFQAWNEGHIPDSIYDYWLMSREHEFGSNQAIGSPPITFNEGWENVSADWKNTDFVAFINRLREEGVKKAKEWWLAGAHSRGGNSAKIVLPKSTSLPKCINLLNSLGQKFPSINFEYCLSDTATTPQIIQLNDYPSDQVLAGSQPEGAAEAMRKQIEIVLSDDSKSA